MRRRFRFVAVLSFLLLWAGVSASAQTPPTGLQGEALRTWLRENLYDGRHRTLTYVEARLAMYNVIDNDADAVVDVYGGLVRALPRNGNESNPGPLNAEHTVPQSFFEERNPMRTDLHHLFPVYSRWNSTRQNYPFREIPDEETTKWMIRDTDQPDPPTGDKAPYSEYANRSFEPREDHKGNVARAVFYFYTMYPDFDIGRVGDIDMFHAWHRADPVGVRERSATPASNNDRATAIRSSTTGIGFSAPGRRSVSIGWRPCSARWAWRRLRPNHRTAHCLPSSPSTRSASTHSTSGPARATSLNARETRRRSFMTADAHSGLIPTWTTPK